MIDVTVLATLYSISSQSIPKKKHDRRGEKKGIEQKESWWKKFSTAGKSVSHFWSSGVNKPPIQG